VAGVGARNVSVTARAGQIPHSPGFDASQYIIPRPIFPVPSNTYKKQRERVTHCDSERNLLLADWTGSLFPSSKFFLFFVNNQMFK
jgi:hypothetical protein